MSKILEWAQVAQNQEYPSGQFPVGGDGLVRTDVPHWKENQLRMPGLAGLLTGDGSTGTGGFSGGVGVGGGGTGGGGGFTLPPTTGGGGGGGGVGGGGANPVTIDHNAYFNLYPGLQNAYSQAMGNPDATYLAQGYPQGPGGWAQFHWDTYGQNEGRQFFPLGSGGLTV